MKLYIIMRYMHKLSCCAMTELYTVLVSKPFYSQSLSSYYVNQIDTDSEHDDPFAKAIYKATGDYKNGVVRVGDRWKTYVRKR